MKITRWCVVFFMTQFWYWVFLTRSGKIFSLFISHFSGICNAVMRLLTCKGNPK
uniref:Uncharacterized protein n=1 Tax=Kalanchoe fedtschenkoi TaxID=63787 RepID=A0A7N0V8B7_KALFE